MFGINNKLKNMRPRPRPLAQGRDRDHKKSIVRPSSLVHIRVNQKLGIVS